MSLQVDTIEISGLSMDTIRVIDERAQLAGKSRAEYAQSVLERAARVPMSMHDLYAPVREQIADVDVGNLDASEGLRPGRDKNSYCRRECIVFLDGDDQRPLTVSAYFGDRQPHPPLPSAAYKNLILTGSRHWHLPEAYIRELEEWRAGCGY